MFLGDSRYVVYNYSPLHKQPQTNSLTSHICRDCLVSISVEGLPQNNNRELQEKTFENDLLFTLWTN